MTLEKIEQWLTEKLSSHLGIDNNDIDLEESIFAYGLDSSSALLMTGEIEDWLGINLDTSFFWEHENLSEIAAFLFGEVNKKTPISNQVRSCEITLPSPGAPLPEGEGLRVRGSKIK